MLTSQLSYQAIDFFNRINMGRGVLQTVMEFQVV